MSKQLARVDAEPVKVEIPNWNELPKGSRAAVAPKVLQQPDAVAPGVEAGDIDLGYISPEVVPAYTGKRPLPQLPKFDKNRSVDYGPKF